MTDKVLRDEIWESDRFLSLPTDAGRLAYIRMLSAADDFGNLEGSVRRLFRMVAQCTQIKSEEAMAKTLEDLIEADLVRMYQVDGRDLVHLPRTRPHRQYIVRKMPASPWDASIRLGKTQRIEARGLAKEEQKQALSEKCSNDIATTSHAIACDVAQGVGVGVGVKKPPLPPKGGDGFAEFWSAYPRKTAKANAVKAFSKLSPSADMLRSMIAAVRQQAASEQWRKDGGQFIPHPATWLNGRRWEDEAPSGADSERERMFRRAL